MSEKKEYIERGALLKAFGCENAVKYGNKNAEQQHKSYSSMMLYEIADEIYDAPAADVEPVVRGEWTMLTADLTDWSRETYVHWLKCSLCGKAVPLRSKSKFCPHCGAHMVERQCAMPFKTQSVEEEKKACADYFERAERSGSGE